MELFPKYWFGYFVAAIVLGMSGLRDEALSVIKMGLATDPENVFLLAALARDHGRRGERVEAIRILHQLDDTARMKYISPSALTNAAIGCGDVERTYEWLNKGMDELYEVGIFDRFRVVTLLRQPCC
jgi:hypothetical protein